MADGEAVLEVIDLRKVYRGKPPVTAVDRLSFGLARGEILGLLGPNGAGKTTTIQMLLSTLKPTSGEILYFGKSLEHARAEILAQVGFASAYSRLPRRLTVAENLDVFGRLHGLDRRERAKRVDELLERFGADDLRKRTMEGLSAGQTTRVTLAKAFLARPKVALLDEPTASLDPDIAVEVRDFVREQRQAEGVSIVFTSHNMEEVARVCDRVVFLNHGRIAGSGTPEVLAGSAAATRLRLRMTDGLELVVDHARGLGLPVTVDHDQIQIELDERDLARFLSAIATLGVDYHEITFQKPTLEDYFLKLSRQAAPDGSPS